MLTDVEGSTELWEWDHAAMMEAIQMHDCLMRAHLRKSGPLSSLGSFQIPTCAVRRWQLAALSYCMRLRFHAPPLRTPRVQP